MKPLVIEYLKTHTFRQLEEEHGVCARPSKNFDKFSLNYDQILARNGEQLSGECRGMVIRPVKQVTADAWQDTVVGDVVLLAWPMNRFYNHGDAACAQVDWSDPGLRVYEKLDGTCCIVYWDPAQLCWHCATRSVPEADLPIRKDDMEIGDMTFSGLFWLAASSTIDDLEDDFHLCDRLDKGVTYVFELTSQHNRIVVRYNEPRITLLAMRELATGRELDILNSGLGVEFPKPQMWSSLHEPTALAAFVNASDPAKLEGAVVCDSRFNRVKVKSKAYVLSSKAKDLVTVSRRSALEAIITGTIDDVIPLVEKDVASQLVAMQDRAREYFASIDRNFQKWKCEANGSRKDFAQKVTSSGDWTAPYFSLWENRAATASEWAQSMAKVGKLSSSSLDCILQKMG